MLYTVLYSRMVSIAQCTVSLIQVLQALLAKFWPISLYLTDDAIAKLSVTQSFVK